MVDQEALHLQALRKAVDVRENMDAHAKLLGQLERLPRLVEARGKPTKAGKPRKEEQPRKDATAANRAYAAQACAQPPSALIS